MPRLPEAYRTHFEIQYVGKMIKAAKRRVMFKFAFEGDDDENSVVLMHTLNSGKKVVFLNGTQIHAEESVNMRCRLKTVRASACMAQLLKERLLCGGTVGREV